MRQMIRQTRRYVKYLQQEKTTSLTNRNTMSQYYKYPQKQYS